MAAPAWSAADCDTFRAAKAALYDDLYPLREMPLRLVAPMLIAEQLGAHLDADLGKFLKGSALDATRQIESIIEPFNDLLLAVISNSGCEI